MTQRLVGIGISRGDDDTRRLERGVDGTACPPDGALSNVPCHG
jgi:hypothetical protein